MQQYSPGSQSLRPSWTDDSGVAALNEDPLDAARTPSMYSLTNDPSNTPVMCRHTPTAALTELAIPRSPLGPLVYDWATYRPAPLTQTECNCPRDPLVTERQRAFDSEPAGFTQSDSVRGRDDTGDAAET
jgi:hypothetical protein